MRVVHRGDARADVQELPDTDVLRKVPHTAFEVGTLGTGVLAHAFHATGIACVRALGGVAVNLEVVLATQQVVVESRWVRDRGIHPFQCAVLHCALSLPVPASKITA